MAATHFLLIRHAEAGHNVSLAMAPMSGWTDVPLTERGIAQAATLARQLESEPPADAIYASPSARARETAAPIARQLGLRLVVDPALREIHCGAADGLPIAEVRRRFAREWAANEARADPDFRWPGGESYTEFRTRALGAMDRLHQLESGRRVIVVTHTGFISQLLGHLNGVSAAAWDQFRVHNASLTEVTFGAGGLQLMTYDRALVPPG